MFSTQNAHYGAVGCVVDYAANSAVDCAVNLTSLRSNGPLELSSLRSKGLGEPGPLRSKGSQEPSPLVRARRSKGPGEYSPGLSEAMPRVNGQIQHAP